MNLLLDSYLSYLQELITKNSNATCAAYELVYNKRCPQQKSGIDTSHDFKTYKKKYQVDRTLKNKWLDDLNGIKDIQMTQLCAGHDKEWIAYIVFLSQRKYGAKSQRYIDKVTTRLEASDSITKSMGSVAGPYGYAGAEGRIRIIVAAPTWYGHKDWERWWSTITVRIKRAIK